MGSVRSAGHTQPRSTPLPLSLRPLTAPFTPLISNHMLHHGMGIASWDCGEGDRRTKVAGGDGPSYSRLLSRTREGQGKVPVPKSTIHKRTPSSRTTPKDSQKMYIPGNAIPLKIINENIPRGKYFSVLASKEHIKECFHVFSSNAIFHCAWLQLFRGLSRAVYCTFSVFISAFILTYLFIYLFFFLAEVELKALTHILYILWV